MRTADSEPDAAPADRGARRRARTRARLLGAARELFAEQGIDATTIQQITEHADVGFGTFYNHFDDKDAIVQAVLEDLTGPQVERVAGIRDRTDDPAEIVAIAHRNFLELAEQDPEWGWLLIRLDVSHRALTRTLGPQALEDIQHGIDSGRFQVDDIASTLNATGGALLGTTRAVLDGTLGDGAGERHAELVLRMLGLDPAEAAEIARRPLPASEPSGGGEAPSD